MRGMKPSIRIAASRSRPGRTRYTVKLPTKAVQQLRDVVLPLTPGISLSDLLSAFTETIAEFAVPLAKRVQEVPEQERGAAVEEALVDLFGRVAVAAMRTSQGQLEWREEDTG
jgi:hypothetical protein